MKTNRTFAQNLILIGAAALWVTGCKRGTESAQVTPTVPPHAPSAMATHALARLEPTQGNTARGTVRFSSAAEGVRVTAEFTGLTPGEHGFHIHEHGDCSAPDAGSAGGHFDPTNQPHAGRDAEARHVGDLGNLTADSSGRAQLNYFDPKLTLTGRNGVVGRSVVVHARRDDLKSQLSGDSGARVACGTIELERRNF